MASGRPRESRVTRCVRKLYCFYSCVVRTVNVEMVVELNAHPLTVVPFIVCIHNAPPYFPWATTNRCIRVWEAQAVPRASTQHDITHTCILCFLASLCTTVMAKRMKPVKNGKRATPAQRKQRRPRGGRMRTQATRVLAQGVGALPRKAFGNDFRSYSLACWDAKLLHHLPLPRAVGPYTVVRTTRRFQTDARDVILGTFRTPKVAGGAGAEPDQWSDIVAIYDVDGAIAINGIGNTHTIRTPLDFLEQGTSMATCTPSALSVQILNPEALQTTSGILYAGVMNTQAHISGRTETWDQFCDRFVQYMSPRLLSAAKLALRGVQINSYPLSMTQVSEFTPLSATTDGDITLNQDGPTPQGWAPIVINNPQGVNIEYLVTTEWRVRFDLSNPASAGHTHHSVASDSAWDALVKKASALGHGVRDIAEIVANGAQAYEAMSSANARFAAARLAAIA